MAYSGHGQRDRQRWIQPPYDLENIQVERYMYDHHEALEMLESQCFAICQHLAAYGYLEAECLLYHFIDRNGYPMAIYDEAKVTVDAIMQTTGFEAIQKLCDTQGTECLLTEFYYPRNFTGTGSFFTIFSTHETIPNIEIEDELEDSLEDLGSLKKGFQLRVRPKKRR
jgi:hypothetical protein